MGRPLVIRTDLATPSELRSMARRERSPRTATRLLAIAHALEGSSRAEAARLAGMERQALRDAIIRYNEDGFEGLRDRPKSGRRPRLSDGEQASLRAVILRGPGGGRDWTLPMLCRWLEARFDKRLHPASLSRIVRRLDLSRQKTRPLHPLSDAQAQAAFAKRGFRARSKPRQRSIRTSA